MDTWLCRAVVHTICSHLRPGDLRYTTILLFTFSYVSFSRLRRGDLRCATILYQHTCLTYIIKALCPSTLYKHFIQALYTSTLSKHFTQALYQSTLSKHFDQTLCQGTLSKHFIKVFLTHFRNTCQGITKALPQGSNTTNYDKVVRQGITAR